MASLVCFSHLRLSFVSVVFDFNASLNDVTPLSPISPSVVVMRKNKSYLLINAIGVFLSFALTQSELSECCV